MKVATALLAALVLAATAAAQDVAYVATDAPALVPVASATRTAPATEAAPAAVTRLLPTYAGGADALAAAIASRLEYPAIAQANGIEGAVILRVRIDETGAAHVVDVVEGLSTDCDAAAVAAVESLPAFTPARLEGRPFARNVRVAVRFSL